MPITCKNLVDPVKDLQGQKGYHDPQLGNIVLECEASNQPKPVKKKYVPSSNPNVGLKI